MLAWYTRLSCNNIFSSSGLKSSQIKNSVAFKTHFSLKIPTNINRNKLFYPSKNSFWYLFLAMHKKPHARKFRWPSNLLHQHFNDEFVLAKSITSHNTLPRSYHFVKYFLHHLNHVNFKPRFKVLKLQKNSFVFHIWDAPYVPSFSQTRLVNDYMFPFIYMNIRVSNKFYTLARHQLCCLLFLNIFQSKI